MKWEYLVEQEGLPMSEREYLAIRGKEGWQLCCVTWSQNLSVAQTYYFKRPIPESKQEL